MVQWSDGGEGPGWGGEGQGLLSGPRGCTSRRKRGWATVGIVSCVAATVLCAIAWVGTERGPMGQPAVELESGNFIARHLHLKHRDKRVSSKQLVSDIKQLLVDVEDNMKYRRDHRRQEREREETETRKHRVRAHEDRNLHDVNHMMDSLQALASSSGSSGSGTSGLSSLSSHSSSNVPDDGSLRRHRAAEARLRTKSEQSAASQGQVTKKVPKEKAAILAKMKALQAQIEGDYSKVTGFGKKAGYVPPPKIPHM